MVEIAQMSRSTLNTVVVETFCGFISELQATIRSRCHHNENVILHDSNHFRKFNIYIYIHRVLESL
jgi:hypothetical protein